MVKSVVISLMETAHYFFCKGGDLVNFSACCHNNFCAFFRALVGGYITVVVNPCNVTSFILFLALSMLHTLKKLRDLGMKLHYYCIFDTLSCNNGLNSVANCSWITITVQQRETTVAIEVPSAVTPYPTRSSRSLEGLPRTNQRHCLQQDR